MQSGAAVRPKSAAPLKVDPNAAAHTMCDRIRARSRYGLAGSEDCAVVFPAWRYG